jgi:hypothetical protein
MALTKVKLIADGVIDVDHLAANHGITTDNIGEGSALYYTDARVSLYLTTNSYATEGFVTTAVSNLVDAAPSTLDTLNELAAALGDDPNFATTVTNSIAGKLPLTGGTLTGNLTVQGSITSSANEGKLVLNSTAANGKEYQLISIDTGNLGLYDGTAYRLWVGGNGNLGIGTISPGAKLEVYGTGNTIRLDSSANQGKTILFRNVGTATAEVKTDGHLKLWAEDPNRNIYFDTSGGTKMTILSGGNVGIGTTSPLSKLNVVGDGTNAGGITLRQGTNQVHYIYTSSQFQLNRIGSSAATWRWGQEGGSDFMTLNSTGLGIGTTTPSYKLDVGGSGRFSELLQVNGPSATTRSDGHGISLFNGNQDYRISFDSENGNRGYLRYNVDVAGSIFHGHIFSAGDFSATPSNLMLIRADGNVGIGTTSPTKKLDVNGPIRTRSSFNVSDGTTQIAGLFPYKVITGAGTDNSLALFTETGLDLHFMTDGSVSSKMIIKSSGNVGIGTTSPYNTLQVSGNLNADNSAVWFGGGYVDNSLYHYADAPVGISGRWGSSGDNGAGITLQSRNSNSTNWYHGYVSLKRDGNFYIGMNGLGTAPASDQVTLLRNGNVGIGTTTPDDGVHIYGAGNGKGLKIEATSGTYESAVLKLYPKSPSADERNWSIAAYKDSSDDLSFSSSNVKGGDPYGSGNTRMLIEGITGNVGIGTTSPDAKLEVVGRIYSAGEAGQRTYTPRHFILGHPGNTGNFTRSINVSTDIGQSILGGIVQLIVHTWQNEHQFGLITWNNAGGGGPVTNVAYTSISSAGDLSISVAVNGSVDNQIDITFTNAHSNAHGWVAYVMGLF